MYLVKAFVGVGFLLPSFVPYPNELPSSVSDGVGKQSKDFGSLFYVMSAYTMEPPKPTKDVGSRMEVDRKWSMYLKTDD